MHVAIGYGLISQRIMGHKPRKQTFCLKPVMNICELKAI